MRRTHRTAAFRCVNAEAEAEADVVGVFAAFLAHVGSDGHTHGRVALSSCPNTLRVCSTATAKLAQNLPKRCAGDTPLHGLVSYGYVDDAYVEEYLA